MLSFEKERQRCVESLDSLLKLCVDIGRFCDTISKGNNSSLSWNQTVRCRFIERKI